MVVVITGAVEDQNNLSEEEYYKKWNQTKTGQVYGHPMEVRSEKSIKKDVSEGFWGTLWADFISSPVVSLGRVLLASEGERDPNFKITEENVRGYEDYLGTLLYAKNEQELAKYKTIVDDIRLKKQIVSESNGFWGTTGKLAGMFSDPTFFAGGLIGGAGIKTVGAITKGFSWFNRAKGFAGRVVADKFGKDFAYSAGGMMLRGVGAGALSGAATGASVAGIDALIENIDYTDALKQIAGMSIFGGGIGLFVGAGKGRTLSLQRKRAGKLVDAIATENPNKLVLSDTEWKNAINNPDLINSKIKDAFGLEQLQTAPDVRANLSPSNVTRSVFNTLADVPFVVVNEKSGEAITIIPSVEAVASSRSAEYLYNLQKSTNLYYSRYLKEKYGETSISKLKAFKDLHVWAGGKDYETFLEELSREGHNPGSSSSAVIREFAQKNYEEIIKPLADYGMEYDLWDYKKTKDFELNEKRIGLEKGIKSNDREISRIVSQRKINIPIGKINGSMKYQDVSIGAVEKHLSGLGIKASLKKEQREVLEGFEKQLGTDVKDSKAFRELTKKARQVASKVEKENSKLLREASQTGDVLLKKNESLDYYISEFENEVLGGKATIDLQAKEAVKPSELMNIGKYRQQLADVNKKLDVATKEKSQLRSRQKLLREKKELEKKIELLEAIENTKKLPTEKQGEALGKVRERLSNFIKQKRANEKELAKITEQVDKAFTKNQEKFYRDLFNIGDELSNLKGKNVEPSPDKLNQLIGDVKRQIKQLSKEEKELLKQHEEITKTVEKVKAERSDDVEKIKKDTEAQTKELEETNKAIEENNKKVYTQEDFEKLPEGERYFPRRYDPAKISRNRVEAIKDIKEGLWSVSKYRQLRFVKGKSLTKEIQNTIQKEDEKLQGIAEEVVSKILHEEDKRFVSSPRKTRGSELHRGLNFSTEYVKDYLIQDPLNALRDYIRNVITDTELIKRFGTLDVNVLAKNIELSYEPLLEKAVSETQRKALIKRRNNDVDDLRCVWCRVRGVTNYTAEDLTELGRSFNHASNIVNNLNVARLIGGTVISATSDLAQACMTVGFKNFFGGLKKWFNKDFREAFMGEEDVWIRAIDHFKNTRQLGFYNQMIDDGVLSAVDNFSGKLADLSVKMSMINKWDQVNKFVVGYVTQERILKIGEKLSKKSKLSLTDSDWLTTTGITQDNAIKMFEQFQKHGRITDGGIWESSVGYWDNKKLQDIFRGAVKKLQNQAVLTPGAGSVPTFFDTKGLKTVLQFKRFTFTAYSKCMLPTLQKKDMEAFSGIAMMLSIGIMKAYLRSLKSGYAISMSDAIHTSLKEAEVGAYLGDAYGLASNFLGLNEKKNRAGHQFIRDMFGTGFDFIETTYEGVPGLTKLATGFGGEMNYSQIHNARKLIPLQNNIFLSKIFDKVEESAIERRGTKRAKNILAKKKEQ